MTYMAGHARGIAPPPRSARQSRRGRGLLDTGAFVTPRPPAGGAAPATGCDAAHANAETHVPYTAIYTFFGVT